MTSIATMTNWARKSLKSAMNLEIVKPARCEACDACDVFAHQPDLHRPLLVKWLCARCETVPPGAVCYAAPARRAPASAKILDAAQWLASGGADKTMAVVPQLREKFGLSAVEAVEALRESRLNLERAH